MGSYKICGEGRPLIFLHGWGTSSNVWENQVDYFSKGYKVATIKSLQSNLDGLLNGFISKERPTLIGWSYGAMLAKELIIHHPNKIRAAVLISSNAKFVCSEDYEPGLPRIVVEKLRRDLNRNFEKALFKTYRLFFSEGEKELYHRHCERASPAVGRQGERSNLKKRDCFTPSGFAMTVEQQIHKSEVISILNRLMHLDLRSILPKINIPVLIIHGTNDAICPIGAGRFLKENIKDARMHEMQGVGHVPFFTRREEFNRILEGFLDEVYNQRES